MISLEPPRGLAVDAHSLSAGDAWRAVGLSRSGLHRFLRAAQTAVALEGEVDVLLTDDGELRRLNRTYRGKNKPTGILSFPAAEELAGVHAGDLAISLETAARQAEQHGHSLRDEVRVLLLHGVLHLKGMDHETDNGDMASSEAALRRQLRLPNGLIARTESSSLKPPRKVKKPVRRSAATNGKGRR